MRGNGRSVGNINTPSLLCRCARTLVGEEVFRSYSAVMSVKVMLGKVVCQVEDAWTPENVEVPLFYSVTNPIEAHVNRF